MCPSPNALYSDRGEDYSATDTDEPSKLHGTGAKGQFNKCQNFELMYNKNFNYFRNHRKRFLWDFSSVSEQE